MSDVKPALTADEWDLQLNDYAAMGRPMLPSDMVTEHAVEMAVHDRETTPVERNHAMAAMCLYGQPFGFTWEDADTLRQIAMYYHEAANRGVDARHPVVSEVGADLENLATRIESLLPPREP